MLKMIRDREIPEPFCEFNSDDDLLCDEVLEMEQETLPACNILREMLLGNCSYRDIVNHILASGTISKDIPTLVVYKNRVQLVKFLWDKGYLSNEDLNDMLKLSIELAYIEITEFIMNLNIVKYDIKHLMDKAVTNYYMYKMDDMSTSRYILFFDWVLRNGYPPDLLPNDITRELKARREMDNLNTLFQSLGTN